MNETILIADDEELERRALRRILGSIDGESFTILEAANGRQAVEAARDSRPELALLDIRMPGVSGIDAARELRSVSPATRCVFVTAFESFDYAREAIRLGVDEYLLKPAEPAIVKETVLRVIARIRAEKADAERRLKSGADGEKALHLLERELRDALDRGSLGGERLYSFLTLKGLREGERFTLVLRPVRFERTENVSIRKATLRNLGILAEKVMRDAGWVAIAGSDDAEVRAAAACVLDNAPAGPLPESVKTLLSKIAERSLGEAGVRVLMGASPSFSADGPELFSAAQDALALASADHPIVILEPAVSETPEDRVGRISGGGPVVERAKEFLRARLAEDPTLADVAASVSCSPFHLSRLFRLHAGDTFVRVFARMRVDAAKALLRSGGYSVKEVGAMVGFSDQTYFARVFKKFEGMTPAEFKAAAR